jgi:fructokinase
MLAGIEAGGTKFVCAVGAAPGRIEDRIAIPTTTPDETLDAALAFFSAHAPLDALGVASFGPIDVDPNSPTYGAILRSPKSSWDKASFPERLAGLQCPVKIDTDVNGAGLAEQLFGAGQDCETLAYVTVGTGIGAGVLHKGKPLSGAGHYEIGHIRPPKDKRDEAFEGVCPFHGDCLEGLASGTAIMARWGASLSDMAAPETAIDLVAFYLADLAATLIFAHRPDRIIFGGGVMKTPGLLDAVRTKTLALAGGYLDLPAPSDFIRPPGLGDKAGVTGALALAHSLTMKS